MNNRTGDLTVRDRVRETKERVTGEEGCEVTRVITKELRNLSPTREQSRGNLDEEKDLTRGNKVKGQKWLDSSR